MAIAKIKKLEIIGLKEERDEILALLQKLEILELINISDAVADVVDRASPHLNNEVNLLDLEEAISYLASFKEKSGLLEGMVKFKPVVYSQQLNEVLITFDCQGLLKELSVLRNHLKNLIQHREKLIQEGHLLAPWGRLKIPLEELHYNTETCGILLGILRSDDYANLLEDCRKENISLFYESVNQDKANTYLVTLFIKEEFERLEAILKTHHFNFTTLSRHKCLVQDRLLEINREILVLDDQFQDARNKIQALSQQQFKLMVTYDYLANIRKRQEANKDLAMQKFTFMLSGWIKLKDIGTLERSLAATVKDSSVFISEPKADEEIPVILENNCILQPFEFITKIYGFPKYSEIDPTPYLAPFFFIYFGFCVSDVGYGFILALLSRFILKKFKMGPQGLRFFRLFFFCAISTIIVGALTGSWFGNLLDLLADNNKAFLSLKGFKDSLIILDPMKEPTKLLGIALFFGIIQVWFGHIVAVIGNIKNKRYLDIFLDQVPMLVLLFGLTGLGFIFLKLSNTTYSSLFKYAALGAALVLILTQGRSEKGAGAKFFYGVYNLYNALSGYLSDILSYSRLWALGLVTGVMATTINLVSMQFSQIFISIVPFLNNAGFIKVLVGTFILVVIFVFGHTVSFFMNLLGAFVHPVRLQFVEFFSKFFKSGGNSFRPFKVETKYINLE